MKVMVVCSRSILLYTWTDLWKSRKKSATIVGFDFRIGPGTSPILSSVVSHSILCLVILLVLPGVLQFINSKYRKIRYSLVILCKCG